VSDDPRVSMEPQAFCALPWCGKSFGGMPKRYRVWYVAANGKRRSTTLEYPEGIDAHHPDGHHTGPVVYICHRCHMAHHSVAAIAIGWNYRTGRWDAARPGIDAHPIPLRIADPQEAA